MAEHDPSRSDDNLDEVLEETFPASDPPANTPETGISIQPTEADDDPQTPAPPQSS